MLSQWMTPDPVAVSPSATVAQALERIGSFRHLAVVDDELRGYLHTTDLQRADPAAVVGSLALHTALVLPVDATLDEALQRLRGSRHDAIWVTDGELVGVFTEHDAVRAAEDRIPADLTVEAVASVPVETVGPDTTVAEALDLLARKWVRHLPVVRADGSLEGVLSWRDLEGRDGATNVGTLVTRPPWTAAWSTPLREVARMMVAHRVGAIPILEPDGMLAGIATRVDLMRAVLATTEVA
ncbi:MAG: CBS domain-containing protein [Alphaproteobacteria bacterium]|nr:CBS domain-containing protein [Alphaproteobacteria bacterium]